MIICHKEPRINFSKQLDKVCTTNLFYFWFIAVKKIYVFRALINSIFGALFCVTLIYVNESLVKISAQKDKLHRTKLVSFELILN